MDTMDEKVERSELGGLRLGEGSPIAQAIPASPRFAMTVQGVVHRTAALLALLVASASVPWAIVGAGGSPVPFLWVGMLVGIAASVLAATYPARASVFGPICAIAEGAALGAIAAVVEAEVPGAAMNAFLLTVALAGAMLFLHLRVRPAADDGFRLGVRAATFAVAAIYLLDLLLAIAGVRLAFLHESGVFGIGACLVILAIAAFNLTLDLEFVQEQVERGAPNSLEWFAAVSIVVTLAWIYVEALRLMALLGGDDE